jgi:hypothetical protein
LTGQSLADHGAYPGIRIAAQLDYGFPRSAFRRRIADQPLRIGQHHHQGIRRHPLHQDAAHLQFGIVGIVEVMSPRFGVALEKTVDLPPARGAYADISGAAALLREKAFPAGATSAISQRGGIVFATGEPFRVIPTLFSLAPQPSGFDRLALSPTPLSAGERGPWEGKSRRLRH